MRTKATLACALMALAACVLVSGEEKVKSPPSLALLVGCTKYPNHDGLRELYGPVNDVPLWAATLTDPKGFAFPKENVTQLAGWPDDKSKRPTYANVVAGFENLIARAQPDSRVVVLLAGHGIQVPIPTTQKDPLDPKNPEPDGLDEVFLPADVEDWTETKGLKNAILDDQVGAWLDRLRDKGAHVLIVFDCCHSGTMTRGGPGVREISRVASPEQLKIDPKAIAAAVEPRVAVEVAKKANKTIPGEETAKSATKQGRGSLVAFYAAQSFEEAPELPFPEDAPILRENYFGMLSWTLVQTLKGRQSPLSYGELQRLVGAKYRSSRGTRPPTPFAEGDLNREVLGMKVWPERQSIFVQKDKKGKLTIDAGLLQSVTGGSILAVHPPPGDKRDANEILAHVRVSSAGPAASTVVPVRQQKKGGPWQDAPKDADLVPDAGRAELVVRDFGDLRLKVFAKAEAVKKAVAKLDGKVEVLIRTVPEEQDADWLLLAASPEEAKRAYGVAGLKGDHVLLVHGEGKTREAKDVARKQTRKVYGVYPLADEKALIGALELDLPKVFKWENLWRVAGGVNAGDGGADHGLELQTLKLKDEDDTKGELLHNGVLHDGQEVLWRASNKGKQPLWVTAFHLDANLGIQVVYSGGVGDGKTVRLAQATTNAKNGSVGQEGMVVFAVPQAAVAAKPDFTVLEQEPLRVATRAARLPGGGGTPFHALLDQAAFHKGTRGIELRVRTTPAILTQSWVVVP